MAVRSGKRSRKRSDKHAGRGPQLVSTGVAGLDRVLDGGFLAEQPVVIRGGSGCGKSVFSLFFAAGPQDAGPASPAVFATFDEAPDRLRGYMKTWGLKSKVTFLDFRPDLDAAMAGKGFELSGVLVRIGHAVEKTGARRLVLDTFDSLFETFNHDPAQVRRDLLRVFEWARKHQVTLLATAGDAHDHRSLNSTIDYVSDCAIHLEQKINNGLMTRTLRVLKRRGHPHGTNEYPFLIDRHGVSVMPVTETAMVKPTGRRRLSTGVAGLDRMLGGKGVWQGSTVMVSGQAGSGKSLLAATMATAACTAGKRVLFFSFEESPAQITRDVRSAGILLDRLRKAGALSILSQRAVEYGIEEHIIRIMRMVEHENPDFVVLDPVSALGDVCDERAFKSMVLRLCHFLRQTGVTVLLTELLPDDSRNLSKLNMSSLVDTWIRLRLTEHNGSFHRLIYVHKSRGTAMTQDIMEFEISRQGLTVGARHRPAPAPRNCE